jgi:hypothetical protein
MGLSAGTTASAANLGTSIGSSSEVNSLVSFELMRNKGRVVEELNEIMENLDLG